MTFYVSFCRLLDKEKLLFSIEREHFLLTWQIQGNLGLKIFRPPNKHPNPWFQGPNISLSKTTFWQKTPTKAMHSLFFLTLFSLKLNLGPNFQHCLSCS